MSYKAISRKQVKKKSISAHANSSSFINHRELKQLSTFTNVSYTDYSALSSQKKTFDSKIVPHSKKRVYSFWEHVKKPQLSFQKGDSLRVEPVKLYDNSLKKQQRVKTEHYQSKVYRNKRKSISELYKFYELQFIQKKMDSFEAEGHKLNLSRCNRKYKQRKPIFRPNTSYLKRNYINNNQMWKVQTVDMKKLRTRQDSLLAIKGWSSEMPQEM